MTSTTRAAIPSPKSNQELIPIYREWASRCLGRAGFPPLSADSDLVCQLRQPDRLLQLIAAVAPSCSTAPLSERLRQSSASNEKAISHCLNFISSLGVNTVKLSAKQLSSGHLGSVLQLLFALFYFKQEQKREQRRVRQEEEERAAVAERAAASAAMHATSRLPPPPSFSSRIAAPSSSSATASPQRLPAPNGASSGVRSSSASGNRPATVSSGLKPPSSRLSKPSPTRIGCPHPPPAPPSSVSSSATYASIPSTASASVAVAPRPPPVTAAAGPSPGIRPPLTAAPPRTLKLPATTSAKSPLSPSPAAAPEALATPPPETASSTASSLQPPRSSCLPAPKMLGGLNKIFKDKEKKPPKAAQLKKPDGAVGKATGKRPPPPSQPTASAVAPSGLPKPKAAPIASSTSGVQLRGLSSSRGIPAPSTSLIAISTPLPKPKAVAPPKLVAPAEKRVDATAVIEPPEKETEKELLEKRCSKSSEDSAYCELSSSGSPSSSSSSTSSSASSSSSSVAAAAASVSHDEAAETVAAELAQSRVQSPSASEAPPRETTSAAEPPSPVQEKPTLAVKALRVDSASKQERTTTDTQTAHSSETTREEGEERKEEEAETEEDVVEDHTMKGVLKAKTREHPTSLPPPQPAIGVVSPMVNQQHQRPRRLARIPQASDALKGTPTAEAANQQLPSPLPPGQDSQEISEKTIKSLTSPRSSSKTSFAIAHSSSSASAAAAAAASIPPPPPPPMSSIPSLLPPSQRHPPSYAQLYQMGRISTPIGEQSESSPGEESTSPIPIGLGSIPRSSASSAISAPTSRISRPTASRASRLDSAGMAVYARLKNFGVSRIDDGYEDSSSSSVSSDISDVGEISTDDLTGSSAASEQMASAYALGRQPAQRSMRSSSTGDRSRHLVNQENITQLLKQCKTPKRGAGCHWPFSATDSTVIDSSAQLPPRLTTPNTNGLSSGLLSLERKSRVSHVYHDHLGPSDSSSTAFALVSPRRVPQSGSSVVSVVDRHSLSARSRQLQPSLNGNRLGGCSGMSRSMVMLEGGGESVDACCCPQVYSQANATLLDVTATPLRRAVSPRTASRLPLSLPIGSLRRSGHEGIYANCASLREGELQRSRERASPCPPLSSRSERGVGGSTTGDFKGSQLSLISSSALSMVEPMDFDRVLRDLEHYQKEVNSLKRNEDSYQHALDMILQRVSKIGRAVEKHSHLSVRGHLQGDEKARMRAEIEMVMMIAGRVGATHPMESGLCRVPSTDSVNSAKSASSRSSRTERTASQASSFSSTKGHKKSWLRSSISRFTSKGAKKRDESASGSISSRNSDCGGPSTGPSREEQAALLRLQRQLAEKDMTLHDVRMDAVSHANEVQALRETVQRLQAGFQRLQVENARMKEQNRQLVAASRASSRASIRGGPDDECLLYEVPPSSSRSSASSKRSSGCNLVRVTVNVDLRGRMTSAISPEHEISIGFTGVPAADLSWTQLDQQLFTLLGEYLERIDPESTLGLQPKKVIIGYQVGGESRDLEAGTEPSKPPHEVISTSTTLRIFLRGAAQSEVDSLVLGTLFPRPMVDHLLAELFAHRRLLLYGATGLGKSLLARQLAALLALRLGLASDAVHELRMPEEVKGSQLVQTQRELESLLARPADDSAPHRVLLLDNLPRARVALVSSAISSAAHANSDYCPFVVCTVNRVCELVDDGIKQTFRTFLLNYSMDGVKGFMLRFLHRRMAEHEFRSFTAPPSSMSSVIDFLALVLSAVNFYIEKAIGPDVTVGPRTFFNCPLDSEPARKWFVTLWNENIIPYMAKVATEGANFYGRNVGSFEDPTDVVCERWPWIEGEPPSRILRRLPNPAAANSSANSSPYGVPNGIPKTRPPTQGDSTDQASSSSFNALETLIRVRTRNHDNVEMVK